MNEDLDASLAQEEETKIASQEMIDELEINLKSKCTYLPWRKLRIANMTKAVNDGEEGRRYKYYFRRIVSD